MHEGILDGTGVADYCSGQPNDALEGDCYLTAFSIIGRIRLGQQDDQARACSIAPEERRGLCYAVVANAVLEEDRNDATGAVGFCERGAAEYRDECILYLIRTARFNFGPNKKQYAHFCAALPEPFKARCTESSTDSERYGP